jgi:hypothetical protein
MKPFATPPLHRGKLIEGWLYSQEELDRNLGGRKHRATDWEANGNLNICAVAGGFAKASYHFRGNAPINAVFGTMKGYGWGRFVQIFHPEQSVVTLYAHLDLVNPAIPWLNPQETDGGWVPAIYRQSIEELRLGGVWLEQGALLGEVGCSGLRGSNERWDTPSSQPLPSCDKPHLHLEFYHIQGSRWIPLDPFDIYGRIENYQNENGLRVGPHHLWKSLPDLTSN